MLDTDEDHVLCAFSVIGGETAIFYTWNGVSPPQHIDTVTTRRQKNQKKGGQSAPRFERLRQGNELQFVKSVKQALERVFAIPGKGINYPIIFAGCGDLKDKVKASLSDSFSSRVVATLTMTKVSKSSDKSMITELLTKALPYINDERVATERKWLSHIFDLVGSGGDLLQFGLDEVQRSLTGGALREVYMQRRVVDDHLDVVDSAVANGCDLKIVETAGLLDDYGGAVGVLWF
eukprot:TRINITY_DN1611_c0_g1_i1.p1 TRINITY_DN1611_c0_g1~~TRINITY_DN1611_c0_g1_i1.p1  ORF type:complete len:234 (+),score=66.70 TRINITY_DN1611_c0_g1_i1:453-1154(+)